MTPFDHLAGNFPIKTRWSRTNIHTCTCTSVWSWSTIGTPLISRISSPIRSGLAFKYRGSLEQSQWKELIHVCKCTYVYLTTHFSILRAFFLVTLWPGRGSWGVLNPGAPPNMLGVSALSIVGTSPSNLNNECELHIHVHVYQDHKFEYYPDLNLTGFLSNGSLMCWMVLLVFDPSEYLLWVDTPPPSTTDPSTQWSSLGTQRLSSSWQHWQLRERENDNKCGGEMQ